MKKISFIIALIGSLYYSTAYSKTKGHYAGIGLIKTKMQSGGSHYDHSYSNDEVHVDDFTYSYGIHYKYALNHKNIFIAPVLFYDRSNISFAGENLTNTRWNLDYRYGIGIDFGYDFTDKIAAYFKGGVASNKYKYESPVLTRSDRDITEFYGLGLKYSLLSNLDIALEYENSEYKADISSPENTFIQDMDLEVARLLCTYKF